MYKPIIGILGRPDYNTSGRKVTILYDSVRIMIEKLGGIPLLIPPTLPHDYQLERQHNPIPSLNTDVEQLLRLCDGLLLQGGSYFFDYDIQVALYARKHDIPTLGICLGMQTLACSNGGKIRNITTNPEIHQNHQRESHGVNVKRSSKLYSIIGTEKIKVNSRHQEEIIETNLDIVGYSFDGKIEAVEDATKRFFIGVQWHPEDMFEYDIVSQKLLTYFINACRGEKHGNTGNYKGGERDLL